MCLKIRNGLSKDIVRIAAITRSSSILPDVCRIELIPRIITHMDMSTSDYLHNKALHKSTLIVDTEKYLQILDPCLLADVCLVLREIAVVFLHRVWAYIALTH